MRYRLDPVLTARYADRRRRRDTGRLDQRGLDASVDEIVEHFTRLFTAVTYAAVEPAAGRRAPRGLTRGGDARVSARQAASLLALSRRVATSSDQALRSSESDASGQSGATVLQLRAKEVLHRYSCAPGLRARRHRRLSRDGYPTIAARRRAVSNQAWQWIKRAVVASTVASTMFFAVGTVAASSAAALPTRDRNSGGQRNARLPV